MPNDSTMWDMASLTKVIAMTSSMMQLVEQHKVGFAFQHIYRFILAKMLAGGKVRALREHDEHFLESIIDAVVHADPNAPARRFG